MLRYGSYEANTEFLLVTQVLDRHGLGYTLSYNAQQQLVRVTDPAGRLHDMTHSGIFKRLASPETHLSHTSRNERFTSK
jgi:YD repeat-containing protein